MSTETITKIKADYLSMRICLKFKRQKYLKFIKLTSTFNFFFPQFSENKWNS